MAITEMKGQLAYAPVYNELVHTFKSTNVAQPKFKFIVDIYVDGVAAPNYTHRLLINPEPVYNYGVVDVHRIMETYLQSDIGDNNATTTGMTVNANSVHEYRIEYGEQYEVAGVITDFPSLTISSNTYVINGSLKFNDWLLFDFNNYLTNTATDRFLTNAPLIQNINRINSTAWLHFLPFDANNPTTARIRTYDVTGFLIGTWEVANNTIFAQISGKNIKVPSGIKNINNIPNAELSVGVQPIITAATYSYDIMLKNNIAAQISEIRTYMITDECKYPNKRLHFLNALGGFDAYDFGLVSKKTTDINRKFYKKNPSRLTLTGYDYATSDREKIQYFTKTTDKMKLTSDWISEAESVWLQELVESPEIYLEDGKNLISIANITASTYETKTDVVDKLYNIEVEIEFSTDNYRQRG